MGTLTLTCYRISATRGERFKKLQGRVVHDCMPSYAQLAELIHGYGNTHILRDLPAAVEPGEFWAQKMRRLLLGLERSVRQAKERALKAGRGSPGIEKKILEKIYRRVDQLLAEALAYHEKNPLVSTDKRGRRKKRFGHNLALRIQAKKPDILRFAEDCPIPFTNHWAERDWRMMKLDMKIFSCFRTEERAQEFVALYRMISTAKKRG